MTVLLIAPASSYSIGKLLENSLTALGHWVKVCDPEILLFRWKYSVNTQFFRLPYRLRQPWDTYFFNQVNKKFLQIFDQEKPDMVLVYNDSLLLPETVRIFRKKARVVFYLGDNPYYTWTKPLFLNLLMEADYIFAPDSMWVEQLRILGIKNIHFEIFGWDKRFFFPKECTPEERNRHQCDLVFIGNNYVINWGYKRALFLSKFANMDLNIYGTGHWQRWFTYFPELKQRFRLLSEPMPVGQVNTICNCSKIYPVDANPGLIHGLHVRVFDCIGSGILPMVEYRKDLDRVFKDVTIPRITNYDEAMEKAQYFLDHEAERRETVKQLQDYAGKHFLPEHALKRMLERIFP
ncbi:MAG: glycosyltransferase [Acidobacteria bacterium]|jgi:hypothetical protein|nr:glycosyltransferase [Acidobacteriota bacterium]